MKSYLSFTKETEIRDSVVKQIVYIVWLKFYSRERSQNKEFRRLRPFCVIYYFLLLRMHLSGHSNCKKLCVYACRLNNNNNNSQVYQLSRNSPVKKFMLTIFFFFLIYE